jgi:hypothetical protein
VSGFYELICDKTMIYMVEVLEDNGVWACHKCPILLIATNV